MSTKDGPDNVIAENEKKPGTIIENYLVVKEENPEQTISRFYAFQTPNLSIAKPVSSIWKFMKEEELDQFMKLQRKSDIKKKIDSKMEQDFPKGNARILYIELMYTTTMFCKKYDLSLQKSAAVLSQFHLTHIYFTSNFNVSAEKAYLYFKELSMSHSLPFLPENSKVFSHSEIKMILEFFCKLYLRFLPLIRFLSLPNFAFYLGYNPEPDVELPDPEIASGQFKGKIGEQGKKGKVKSQKTKSNKKGKS
nr:uncharacterized protein LOC111512373 isoform X1 [Leptinotarsa decemlineata]